MTKSNDPVHYYEGKWWFWDETWANRIGPYDTRGTATNAVKTYAKGLDRIENYDEEANGD